MGEQTLLWSHEMRDIITSLLVYTGDRGSTVVKIVWLKSEGRWFDLSGFLIDIKSFRSHYGPGVDSASNRN